MFVRFKLSTRSKVLHAIIHAEGERGPGTPHRLGLSKPRFVLATSSAALDLSLFKYQVMSQERNSMGLRPMSFYGKCMFGGVLACGVTHASVVTLDVAKCRAQVSGLSNKLAMLVLLDPATWLTEVHQWFYNHVALDR